MKNSLESAKAEDVFPDWNVRGLYIGQIIILRLSKSTVDLIIINMLPYNVVKGPEFQRLNFVDPKNWQASLGIFGVTQRKPNF